ncbi:hypothetical protein Tco_0788778 [Tanacetum coccineum]
MLRWRRQGKDIFHGYKDLDDAINVIASKFPYLLGPDHTEKNIEDLSVNVGVGGGGGGAPDVAAPAA